MKSALHGMVSPFGKFCPYPKNHIAIPALIGQGKIAALPPIQVNPQWVVGLQIPGLPGNGKLSQLSKGMAPRISFGSHHFKFPYNKLYLHHVLTPYHFIL